jgi:hypothetical protein
MFLQVSSDSGAIQPAQAKIRPQVEFARWNMKRRLLGTLAALALAGAMLAPASASAHVSVGIGINLGPPLIYGPPVVAYAPPPPVVYAPPPVVYYGPPVVYGPTVIYRPYYGYRHRCWWDDGYRVCR